MAAAGRPAIDRSGVLYGLLSVVLCLVLVLPAVAAGSEARNFEIAAGPANVALREYARQAQRQVLLPRRQLEDYRANAVSGRYTPDEALALLLAGTALSAVVDSAGILTVKVDADSQRRGDGLMKDSEKNVLARILGFFASSTAAAGLIATTGAVAQDGSEQSASSRPLLEEVIVTATRRGESRLMDTPIAVSVLSGSDIEKNATYELADILKDTPSVGTITYSPGDSAVQIRGISALNGASTVGYYLDEFPFPAVNTIVLPDVDPYDLARLEVLRGPQGTLYGDGSIGGTVRIITRDPDLDEFQFKASGSYFDVSNGGSNDAINAAVNIPIIPEKLAFRGVASRRNFGGFLDNGTTGEEDINSAEIESYRGKLKYQATDNLSVIASAWVNDRVQDGRSFGSEDLIATTEEDVADKSYELYNLTISYDLEGFSLISSTSLFDSDSD
ncbi:MAG: TonB-dependent receptor plug domain-containing protein, partial [Pseudomonadales bacterium]